MLDGDGHLRESLSGREADVLAQVGKQVASGHLTLPHLSLTSLTAMGLTARPSVEIRELVEAIATDPVLSSELLRASNSALYAGSVPCTSLHQAVVRMGLRAPVWRELFG